MPISTRSKARAAAASSSTQPPLLELGEKLLGLVASALDLRSLAAAASTSTALRGAVLSCTDTSKRQRAVAALLRYDQTPHQTPHLSPAERRSTVAFISDVSEELKLHGTTTGLAVTYLDRFLSAVPVPAESIELHCLASLRLACKFADTKVPVFDDYSDDYPPEVMNEVEMKLIVGLGWDLNAATPYTFLEQLGIAYDVDDKSRKGADFYIELSYYDASVLKCSPMAVAAGCLLHSWEQLGQPSEGQRSRRAELALLCGVDQAIIARLQGDIAGLFGKIVTVPMLGE